MSTLMEEGELPEEGEITEDEEEQTPQNPESSPKDCEKNTEKRDSSSFHSKKNFALVSTGSSAKTSKYRDYDEKATRHSDVSQSLMTSSWMSGTSQQRRSRPTNNTTSSRMSDDGNRRHSDGGSAGSSPKSSANHKGRSAVANESMDQDFRRMPSSVGSTSFGEKENVEDDPFGMENDEDNDYRQVSFEQKRRHTADDSATFATKRAKPSALIDPFAGGSGEPTAGEDVDESTMNSSAAGHDESASGGYYRRGQRPPPPHWASHTICKFFREGYCRDGDNCAFSHNAADSNRRTELCKFYVQGFCKRGMNCSHLHGEFPCKSFHRGGCTNEACPFSHRPLDDFIRPIFEQALHDEEAASNVSLPSHPQKRKVLLPQGPETVDGEPTEGSPPPADSSITANTTANAPPSLVTPSRQQSMTIQQIKQRAVEDKALAAAGTFGFFNPVTPTAAPKPPASTAGAPIIPPPTFIAPPTMTSVAAADGTTPLKPPPLGAFATPPVANGGQRIHGASHHHGGFYNMQTARAANMPPPALLTVPPPIATVTVTAATTAPPPAMMVPPPSVVASSGGFFNPPAVVVPSPAVVSSIVYQPTKQPPPITSSLFGHSNTTAAATPIAPPTSSPTLPSLIGGGLFGPSMLMTKSSVEEPPPEEKPLTGMFSGGFFGNSSSMKKEPTKADAPSMIGGLSMGGGDGGAFNISAMLEKITQQATASSASLPALPSLNSLIASTASKWEDESPASPTNNEPSPSSAASSVKMIPIIREWKLYRVDMSEDIEDELNVDMKWIGLISSGSYKNDPRLKKLAEKQFDMVTKTLEQKSNLVAAAKPSEQLPAQPSTSSGGSSGNTSPSKKNATEPTVGQCPADPRVKAPLDPRKRSAPSLPATSVAKPPDAAGLYSDFFNTSFPSSALSQPSTAGEPSNKLADDIFQSMVQQQLKLVNQMQQQQQLRPNNNSHNGATVDGDLDHRTRIATLLCSPRMTFLSFPPPPIGQKIGFPSPSNPPMDPTSAPGSMMDGSFVNSGFGAPGGFSESFTGQRFGGRLGGDRGARRGGGEFQPRFPGKSKSTDSGQNGQRWNQPQQQPPQAESGGFGNRGFPKRNSTNSGQSPAQSQPAATESAASPPTVPAAPQQPISLREKRKNNEYESPLARMSLSRY